MDIKDVLYDGATLSFDKVDPSYINSLTYDTKDNLFKTKREKKRGK